MNPGSELDALIAEKVMGWKRIPAEYGRKELWSPPGLPSEANIWNIEPKHYSTDIAAAWPIAQRMGISVISIEGEKCWAGQISSPIEQADSVVDERLRGVIGETAAHAICLAAIKIVEAEVK